MMLNSVTVIGIVLASLIGLDSWADAAATRDVVATAASQGPGQSPTELG
jgi:hypothetical protein